MSKRSRKSRLLISGAWALGVIGIAGICLAIVTGYIHRLDVLQEQRSHAAYERLDFEWRNLAKERLIARWEQKLVAAKVEAVDLQLSLNHRAKVKGDGLHQSDPTSSPLRARQDANDQRELDRAEQDATTLAKKIETAPEVCGAAIADAEKRVTAAEEALRKVRNNALRKVGIAVRPRTRLDEIGDPSHGRHLKKSIASSTPAGCLEWYSDVVMVEDVTLPWEQRVLFHRLADIEAKNGTPQHYMLENALK